jgi:hypothetical protein
MCLQKNDIVPVHTMKAYGGTEVQFYSFLTSAQDGGELSLRPARFAPRKEPQYPWNRRLRGDQNRIVPLQEFEIRIVQPLA